MKTFVDLAVEYAYAMLRRAELRKRRSSLKCEHTERPGKMGGGDFYGYDPGVPECWRGDGKTQIVTPTDEWCANCKKSVEVHAEYLTHQNKVRSLYAQLKRAARYVT